MQSGLGIYYMRELGHRKDHAWTEADLREGRVRMSDCSESYDGVIDKRDTRLGERKREREMADKEYIYIYIYVALRSSVR